MQLDAFYWKYVQVASPHWTSGLIKPYGIPGLLYRTGKRLGNIEKRRQILWNDWIPTKKLSKEKIRELEIIFDYYWEIPYLDQSGPTQEYFDFLRGKHEEYNQDRTTAFFIALYNAHKTKDLRHLEEVTSVAEKIRDVDGIPITNPNQNRCLDSRIYWETNMMIEALHDVEDSIKFPWANNKVYIGGIKNDVENGKQRVLEVAGVFLW